MRRLSLPLLAFVMASAPAGAAEPDKPAVGELKTFGDWTVGCSNLKGCTALGLPPEDGAAVAYLKVLRGAGGEARPEVSVVFLPENEDATDAPLDLELQGAKDTPLPVASLPGEASGGYAVAPVGAQVAAPFLAALLKGETLSVRQGGTGDPVAVSLKGMSAALRYMDAEQGREGGVTALVAKGGKPAEAVPAAPSPAPVRALKLTGLDPVPALPEGIPKPGEDCGESTEPEAYEAANGARIFGICSFAAAYNSGTEYWLADQKGVRQLSFLVPGEDGSDFDGLVNAGLDEHGLTMIDFNKGRGIGDCGSTSSWNFDGEAFRLVQLSALGECRGVSPGDWPELYSRPTAGE
ncbi:DUF1176 domain-containing protein [Aureimonas sp. ME7]|uniref:DUF1176 domain-containing protein n=1 Tax=Aureimonas sp. ME7 TaxID=2744252 RepID=UPI0015F3BEB3|nr:DUF1176 domain-containing protein [Aureimonas sp. ME7]